MPKAPTHLTRAQCAALARGELPPPEAVQQLFSHLLQLCPVCLKEWQEFRDAEGDAPSTTVGSALDEAVREVVGRVGALRKRVEREQRKAGELLHELQHLPDLHARITRVRRSRRFRSWALCERLFEEARSASFMRPDEGTALAELAIETAWALDDGNLGREMISDLLARGWALLANARRLGGQLELAAETLSMAYFFVEQGTGDPLVSAEIAAFEGSLRRDQLRFSEALELHDRCLAIYRELGEAPLEGGVLLQKAVTLAATGALEEAIELLARSLELIDGERDPRLRLCARHTLILYLDRLGRHGEADRLLAELAPPGESLSDPWSRLRHHWLEGQLAESRGQAPQAERAFRELQWGFLDGSIYHRAAPAPRSLVPLLASSDEQPASDNGG